MGYTHTRAHHAKLEKVTSVCLSKSGWQFNVVMIKCPGRFLRLINVVNGFDGLYYFCQHGHVAVG